MMDEEFFDKKKVGDENNKNNKVSEKKEKFIEIIETKNNLEDDNIIMN